MKHTTDPWFIEYCRTNKPSPEHAPRETPRKDAHVKGGRLSQRTSPLAGLLRCGRCGHRLTLQDSRGKAAGPRYACCCLSFGARDVDQAIEREVLRTLAAAKVTPETQHALRVKLAYARNDAERARRRYGLFEDSFLETTKALAQWDVALEQVDRLERRLEDVSVAAQISSLANPAVLRALSADLPRVWAKATETRMKRRIVRLALKDIVVWLSEAGLLELSLHWAGGTQTVLLLRRTGRSGIRTAPMHGLSGLPRVRAQEPGTGQHGEELAGAAPGPGSGK
jgi:hypothetical protein